MADRRGRAIVVVAGLVAAVFAMGRAPQAGAQPQPPELRRRPADVVLDDGFDHVIVHASGAPSGDGVVSAEALGGGDWSLVLERGTDPTAVAGVEAVTADVWLDPYGAGAADDPYLGQTWGIDNDGRAISGWPGVEDADMDVATAWDRARGGGITVAVVDSGVDRTHPDLRDRMWVNEDETCGDGDDDDRNGYVDDCLGWDFVRNDSSPYDAGVDSTHGTHVAGTIAATANDGVGVAGVAPAATIMGLKVSESASFRLSDALAAVNYAVANGADVINASWGTTGVSRAALAPMEAAIERAAQAGVMVVAAAGNDARDIDVSPSFPASFPQANVLSVAASTNAEAHAYFSNFGRTSVDVHAPGWFVWSTLPGGGYGYQSGTSMAAPHVAGAVALAMSLQPTASIAELRAAVLGSVDRLPAYDGRTATGGRVNAASLVGVSDLPVAIRFAGEPGAWTVDATASELPAGDVRMVAGLATRRDGAAWAVAGHPVSLGGTWLTTDDAGWVSSPAFDGSDLSGLRVSFDAELPAGEYSLVVGFLDAATGEPIGAPQAAFGTIGAPVEEAPPAPTSPPTTSVPPGPAPTDGYEPAPLPPTGQPVPPPPSDPQPCATCGSSPAPAPHAPPAAPWPADDDPRPPAGDDAPPWSPPPRVGDGPAWTPPSNDQPSVPPVWWAPPQDGGGAPVAPVLPPWSPSQPAPTAPVAPTSPPPAPGVPAPSTPAPAPSTPPQTVAPVSPPPTTAPQQPSGSFGIYTVEPPSGRTTGGTTVAVRGTALPSGASVRIGGTPADVRVDLAPELLLVETRAHVPGTFDLVVSARDGRTQTLRSAFTYVAEGAAPGPSTTTTVPAPLDDGAPPVPTTVPPTTVPPATEPAPEAAPPAPPVVDGLRLERLGDDHPLSGLAVGAWPLLRCTDARGCAGTVLRWPAAVPTIAAAAGEAAPPAQVEEHGKGKGGGQGNGNGKGKPAVPPGQAKKQS